MAPATFRFLNKAVQFPNGIGWNEPTLEKLWLYNLHYFDDLGSEDAIARRACHRALIDSWIAENHPAQGHGWEPYPTSLRTVNWIKWALAGNPLEPAWLDSLASQARALRRRVEWHLLGNHLFANAKALVFAGTFFEGEEAEGWRRQGYEMLAHEIPEQILGDGGHFERSPMYHAAILEDLLDLINLSRAYPDTFEVSLLEECKAAARRMRSWLATMCHPDGQIAFFNDAALGIAAEPSQLTAYAKRLALEEPVLPATPIQVLHESGYVRVVRDRMVALLDVAPVGPDYQPGHAHADTLSFELSLHGQRVIVNSGTSEYGTGPERHRQRSTAAHSTVEVDGQNSSEIWAGFRVARRARPFDLVIDQRGTQLNVSCAHDGYLRLRGRVVHRRKWTFDHNLLCVTDSIEGRFLRAVARYHLHPDVKSQGMGDSGTMVLARGQHVSWQTNDAIARVSESSFHPAFGVSQPNRCIEVPTTRRLFTTSFAW